MTTTVLAVALTFSVCVNLALGIFAAWQHRIIKIAAAEQGINLDAL